MARTTAPLFSLDASGSIAKTIVFSKWKGRPYVRVHATPSNPKTGLQVAMRTVLAYITQGYAALSDAIKARWANAGASDNITALNAQVRDAGGRARLNEGWRQDPAAATLGTIDAPTGIGATAAPGALAVSWTRPAAHHGDYTAAVYVSPTVFTVADISMLKAIVAVTVTTATLLGIDTTIDQYVAVRETSAAGELGTLSAVHHYVP